MAPHARKLKSVPKSSDYSGVQSLLSGKLSKSRSKTLKGKKKKRKLTEPLPEDLAELGDILVAGRKVEREVDFKLRFAEQKVKEYCLKRFCDRFADTGTRPSSIDYEGKHSHFTYIQTRRITLTPEKAETLRHWKIPIDDYTELQGVRINYRAIAEHKLESKLKEALANLGLSDELLEECFTPDVQLKEAFFEHLSAIVTSSLGERERGREKLANKIHDVVQILSPASQIRNAETPKLNASQCFDLIQKAEIYAPDEFFEDDADHFGDRSAA
jgi:hypothetical protein